MKRSVSLSPPNGFLKNAGIVLTVLLGAIGSAVPAAADSFSSIPSYYSRLRFNLTGPSSYSTSIGGYYNPAVYRTLEGGEAQFSWTDTNNDFASLKEWGLFLGARTLGFGLVRNRMTLSNGDEARVNDMRIGLSFGNRTTTVGYGFGWSSGDDEIVGRSNIFQSGIVHRFNRYVSLGLVGTYAIENRNQSGLADVAIRPLGTQLLTLFADGELPRGISIGDAPWSAGAMIEPVPGVQFIGRYFDDENYSLSIGVSIGGLGIRGTPNFNSDGKTTNTTYEIRTGYPKRSLLEDAVMKDGSYLAVNLHGRVTYRGFRYFDPKSHPLLHLLRDLEYARNDPAVRGVAINAGGMRVSVGKAWEIREKLLELQSEGKRVVIFVESMGMTNYHFASVADKIVMDPEGLMVIPGYVMGRTFVKDLLAKLGIGFDEWRFFKYKSAAEGYSRTEMSEPDREQRFGIIEDLYATVRSDVSASREVDGDTFDKWVNENIVMNAHEAEEFGLVDKLGRWEDVADVIGELEGERKGYMSRQALAGNRHATTLWGEDPRIAVVYALGSCSMDSGIDARRLEKIFQGLRRDRRVKAVVLRVDSPGGLSIASDVVAVQMKKLAERKPIIVSQGDVAASGGYWLSMYGDKIFALPATITGSIGVIGGWMWDDGLGEKIGHTSDHVKIGDKADYAYGIRLLLAGPSLPRQNLPAEDRERVEKQFMSAYNIFLDKVAAGRGIARTEVDKIAQGRVFSGIDGIDAGLVDEIGGLEAAIRAARGAAGIDDDEQVKIVEYPKMPAFNLSGLRPFRPILAFFGVRADDKPQTDPESNYRFEWTYLQTLMENVGRPMVMLPPEYYVEEAETIDR
jgi:protease-4